MRTTEYLDLAKKKAGLPSDYALAAKLGVTRQAVSQWRNGRSPEPLFSARLAELAQVEPLIAIADIEIEKAEKADRPEAIEQWRGFLSRALGVTTKAAAVALTMGTLLTAPSPARATMATPQYTEQHSVYYVNRRKRKNRAWLLPLLGLKGMH